VQVREVTAGSSYQSTSAPWPTFGLAHAAEAEVCVRWPGGGEEVYGPFDADRRVEVVQDDGAAQACAAWAEPGPPSARASEGCGCGGGRGGWGGVGLLAAAAAGRRRRGR
jgi:hypothetical protein